MQGWEDNQNREEREKKGIDQKRKTPKLRDKQGLTEEEFLAAYQPGDYVRPSVATDMVIFTVTDGEEEN